MRGSIEKRRLHVERVCVNVNFDLNPLFNMMCGVCMCLCL